LNNVRLTSGKITGEEAYGGAISNEGDLTINGVNCSGNVADRYGGAIYNDVF
jgi:hypothetical protein